MSFGEARHYHICAQMTKSDYKVEGLTGITPPINCTIEAGGGSAVVMEATFHQPAAVSK